jgi:3',5'-cyclic AMP phosphodiesterase CpdA
MPAQSPTNRLLLTILQISDLHIGAIDPATGDALISTAAAQLFANFTWFDGVLGHHARALQDLKKFRSDLVDAGEDPLVIVSGDITRVGDGVEFDTANDFLSSQIDLNPPHGNYVGLHCSKWLDTAIPGNHDHWPGRPVVRGGPHPTFATYFPPNKLPYVWSRTLANGRVLQLIGVNTDADVNPNGHNKRLRAVGSFQSQLARAAPILGAKKSEDIRVLLMHHSWHKRGPLLSIDRGTRGALNQFFPTHGIQIVLTGHTHKPLHRRFVITAGDILECRCGTTTQHDQIPYLWRTLFGTFPRRWWSENTLLVHRLYDEGGSTRWYVETFVRTKAKGFDTIGVSGKDDILV